MKITPLNLLLVTTFLSTSAVAQTVPEINANYLNGLTGEKVTWEEVNDSGENTVQIGDKFYKYTYHKPDNYTETSEHINGNLTSDIVDVIFRGINSNSSGGALTGSPDSNLINADFVDNYTPDAGGAIYDVNDTFTEIINTINGDFIGNHSSWEGGAIEFLGISAKNIKGNFINNYVISNTSAIGGALALHITTGELVGNFIGNHAVSDFISLGGAITTLSFDLSKEYSDLKGKSFIVSGSFINNYSKVTEEGGIAVAGAISSTGELNIVANGQTNLFRGNYVEDAKGNRTNNAIYMSSIYHENPFEETESIINFEIKNNGSIIFEDEIDGGYVDMNNFTIIEDGYSYNINISGDVYNTDKTDETNTIRFNDLVNNVYDFSIDSVQMALGKNAVINIVHNYVAKNNPYLRLDLDAVNREVGQINIEGDVDGTTNVIVNVLQNKETAKEESIVFATAVNDTLGDEDSFKVSRVIGSPYMWKVNYDTTEKQWGLYSTEEQNPDYEEDNPDTPDTPVQPLGPIKVAPEVVATVAVKTAGLSQTNGMVYNIMRKVGVNRLFCPGCGFYDYNWDGEAFHNVWVDTTYNGLTIEAPVEIDAKVWGIEAGSDLQHDLNNKLGIFVSYRQGNYEMDGKGEKYYSNIGSEIDIDSYLAGLYYRYDYNDWYAFATLYGGMQNAEIQTDDGAANYDTDGIEFGGSIEAGYNYALTRTLSVTPSLGAFYSQISYDDATDNVGKTVEYNDLKQVELEAGAKFAYTQYTDDGFYSLYVKPSVVQTLIDGDEIEVTKLGKVDTVEDKTLGRVELGGNIGFNDNWSAYGWANYTFGSDYEATSLGAGVNYAW